MHSIDGSLPKSYFSTPKALHTKAQGFRRGGYPGYTITNHPRTLTGFYTCVRERTPHDVCASPDPAQSGRKSIPNILFINCNAVQFADAPEFVLERFLPMMLILVDDVVL